MAGQERYRTARSLALFGYHPDVQAGGASAVLVLVLAVFTLGSAWSLHGCSSHETGLEPSLDSAAEPAEDLPEEEEISPAGDLVEAGDSEEGERDLLADPADDGEDQPDLPDPGFPGLQVVNPLIGTGAYGAGVGNTFPGAAMPFGMVKVSPDTQTFNGARLAALHCAGYRYEDSHIEGFSHTHLQGTGIPDYGSILFMPAASMDATKTNETGYRAPFDHLTERTSPGYYSVEVGDPAIRVELTASLRSARHRYRYPAGMEPWVIIDLGHTLEGGTCTAGEILLLPEEARAEGWMTQNGGFSGRYGGLTTYFSARFDTAWEQAGTWHDGVLSDGSTGNSGERVGSYLRFPQAGEGDDTFLQAAVGISFVSVEQARQNLEAEIPGFDFEATRQAAEEAWEEALSVVEVSGGTQDQLVIFYTSLYHALMMPTLFSDASGLYLGFDRELHQADGFLYYTDFSLWDTYRTLHPLLTLLFPDRQRDMIVSLIRMYQQGGYFPKWPQGAGYTNCMVATSADIVVADSYLKGITDFDAALAFEGLQATADGPTTAGSGYEGREHISEYLELGYVPADLANNSVSLTLEFSYDDFALAQLAEALGRPEDANRYRERATSYRNVWDPRVDFFRARMTDGSFIEYFRPTVWASEYTEGNAWHYRFFVPHDVAGLIELFGSRAALVDELEIFFGNSTGWALLPDLFYWHGNEPDLHSAFVFVEAGRPDRAQYWSRWVLQELYRNRHDGLPGNEDAGTLSAWYVFAALGFYPVPATDRYLVGSPLFNRVRLHLPGGTFELSAPEASDQRLFIQSARLNDEPLERPWLFHHEIAQGGQILFEMGDTASSWGRAED
ncbi:MAG: GH92 family glycosyl hydrolase [Bradymonadales bacterium]|nr:GH92 family glycosyl hydrolase [Bradymonadales bacterium]